jgi:hypothetical protein
VEEEIEMTAPTKRTCRAHPAEKRRKGLWRSLVTDERIIAIGCGYGATREEAEANAQLFAAAWEMREALVAVLADEYWQRRISACQRGYIVPVDYANLAILCRAALAKADGTGVTHDR